MKKWSLIMLALFATGCASLSKNCAQFSASSFGSNWIVVQYAADGHPFHCWKLSGASVTGSEGGQVDWQDPTNGHLVHLTGWENRVQVVRGDYDGAARLLGVDAARCGNGAYPTEK